ncbi:MAG: hypothetical protein H7230_03990 [Candidatus Parcubacteria bacterium]|nr:hypothetical protein [Candidatus Paceibacterota bacterium]
MQIIINAGGTGSRLWPLSTAAEPKQFASIVGKDSLISQTVLRLQSEFENIWVATNTKYLHLAKQQLKHLIMPGKILVEPTKRDTFGAIIAHSCLVAHHTSVDETLIFISSDHYIDDQKDLHNFCGTLHEVDTAINESKYSIILPATKPYFASTEYGYIQIEKSPNRVSSVIEFKEKPGDAKAKEFLEQGNYFWNLGYYGFSYAGLRDLVGQIYPELLPVLNNIYTKGRIDSEDYLQFPEINFEQGLIEKLIQIPTLKDKIGAIDMGLTTWDDIGNFETLYGYLPEASADQTTLEVDGNNNRVKMQTSRPLALVGVSGLVIIENKNGILIMDPKKAKNIRKVAKYFDV